MYKTKNDVAYETIKNEIISGKIPMGSKVTVSKCAEKYGLSTMPIREALRRLEQDGIVVSEPNVGAKVVSYTLSDHLDIVFNRISYQMMMIKLACIYIDDDRIKTLEDLLMQMEENLSSGNIRDYIDSIEMFYRVINHSTPFHEMEKRIDNCFEKARLYNSFIKLDNHRSLEMLSDFRELLKALESRDPDTCAEVYNRIQQADFKEFQNQILTGYDTKQLPFPRKFLIGENGKTMKRSELAALLERYQNARLLFTR